MESILFQINKEPQQASDAYSRGLPVELLKEDIAVSVGRISFADSM